jgi:hypothetical protein
MPVYLEGISNEVVFRQRFLVLGAREEMYPTTKGRACGSYRPDRGICFTGGKIHYDQEYYTPSILGTRLRYRQLVK